MTFETVCTATVLHAQYEIDNEGKAGHWLVSTGKATDEIHSSL